MAQACEQPIVGPSRPAGSTAAHDGRPAVSRRLSLAQLPAGAVGRPLRRAAAAGIMQSTEQHGPQLRVEPPQSRGKLAEAQGVVRGSIDRFRGYPVGSRLPIPTTCLLYTSDAADDLLCV